jgi:hypothetical protein
MKAKSVFSKLKPSMKVFDKGYGKATVIKVTKTRAYLRMHDVINGLENSNWIYDIPHVNNFIAILSKKRFKNNCVQCDKQIIRSKRMRNPLCKDCKKYLTKIEKDEK